MRPALVAQAVAALLAAACESDAPQRTASRAAVHDTVAQARTIIACATLPDSLLRATPTRAGLDSVFGRPDSIQTTIEPNRHVRNEVDSLFVLHYPGLVVNLRRPASGRDMVEELSISSNGYLRHPEIGVGTARAQLLQRIRGAPRSQTDSTLTFDCSDAAEQPTTFYLDAERVSRIHITFYVD